MTPAPVQPPTSRPGLKSSNLPFSLVKGFSLAVIALAILGLEGCSGGKKGGGGNNNPTGPETYNVTVNVTVQGAGSGDGQVSGNQVSCQIQGGQAGASGCAGSMTMSSGSLPATYTLTAAAAAGSQFVTWGGACAGAGAATTCQVTIPKSQGTKTVNATAQFDVLPGAIAVTTETTGSELDADGYTVTIGAVATGPIGINDIATLAGLLAGDYAVTLDGVADNCTVAGDNPRTLTVTPGNTTPTTFSITCVPTKGSIEVTTVTQGNAEDLDDEYTVAIGGAAATTIGINATETYSLLEPGDHAVTLGDIAPNCTLDDGDNPRTLTVVAGQTTQTTFNLTCAPTTGNILVTTVTQGDAQDLDPDGYTVTIDQGAPDAIGINATEIYRSFLPGAHTVTLGDLDGTCAVSGVNPVSATVVVGQDVQVTFNVTCGTPTGISAKTSTIGSPLPTTLTVSVDGGAAMPIEATGTVDFFPLTPGNHSVELGGIPKTCIVQNDNPRTINVVDGALTITWFTVNCVPENDLAFEQVSARGDKDICLLDPYADNPTVNCITGGPGDTFDDVHPVWGPRQEWLLFASNRDGDFEIYRMNPDGSGVTQLTDNSVYDGEPDVYFDGTLAAFTSERSGNKDIWEMDLTQPSYPVTQKTTDPGRDFNPTYVAHNLLVMFTSDRDGDQDIWRVDPSGGVSRQTNNSAENDDVKWQSPYLYFSTDKDGNWDVIRRVPGTIIPDVEEFDGPSDNLHPEPGPLGRWIAAISNRDGNWEIYKKNIVTGEMIRLTNTGVAEGRPAWWASWL